MHVCIYISYTLSQCSDDINCLFSWQSLCPAKFGEVITYGEYKSISIMSGWIDWSYKVHSNMIPGSLYRNWM